VPKDGMGRIIRALIGGCKQRRPDIDAERLCGLEVNLAALCFSLADRLYRKT
jgi:hypothetical protein